jgi:hypothetical protein
MKSGMATAYDIDVAKVDSAISEELRTALLNPVKSPEDISPSEKTGIQGQMERLLTSLFPLVYGVSRTLLDSTATLEDCVGRPHQGKICNTRGLALGRTDLNKLPHGF